MVSQWLGRYFQLSFQKFASLISVSAVPVRSAPSDFLILEETHFPVIQLADIIGLGVDFRRCRKVSINNFRSVSRDGGCACGPLTNCQWSVGSETHGPLNYGRYS